MDKARSCPEFDGTNAISVEQLFFQWLIKREWKKVLDTVRQNNIEYWTIKQAKSLSDLLDGKGLKNELGSFISLWEEWTGEVPIKPGPTKAPLPTGRRSIELRCGSGKVVHIKVKYARQHPTTDDRKNGTFYLDRQLNGLDVD